MNDFTPSPARVKQRATVAGRIDDPATRKRFVDLLAQADEHARQAAARRDEAWELYHSSTGGMEFV